MYLLFSEAKPNLCLYQRNYRTQKIKLIFIAGKWEKGNETVLLRKNEKKRTKKKSYLISFPAVPARDEHPQPAAARSSFTT